MKLITVVTILVLSASALCAQTYEQEKAMDPDWGVRRINLMASVSYSSTIVGGPEWNRAFADCTCCSALGPSDTMCRISMSTQQAPTIF